MDKVLAEIKKYIDNCQNCDLYQYGQCGYIFKDRHDWPIDKTLCEEEYYMMGDYERKMFFTQKDHNPCDDQSTAISFLNSTELARAKMR